LSDMYQITYDVRPCEAGYQKTLQPDALLNYLQDAAFKHSISRGFSAFHLFKKGLTWVLSRSKGVTGPKCVSVVTSLPVPGTMEVGSSFTILFASRTGWS